MWGKASACGRFQSASRHFSFIESGRLKSACDATIYIMRRTQVYLDDRLWNALQARARSRRTTISELVREALRERYLAKQEEQRKPMQEFVGSRKARSEPLDVVE